MCATRFSHSLLRNHPPNFSFQISPPETKSKEGLPLKQFEPTSWWISSSPYPTWINILLTRTFLVDIWFKFRISLLWWTQGGTHTPTKNKFFFLNSIFLCFKHMVYFHREVTKWSSFYNLVNRRPQSVKTTGEEYNTWTNINIIWYL